MTNGSAHIKYPTETRAADYLNAEPKPVDY